jgi:hypothetical protein
MKIRHAIASLARALLSDLKRLWQALLDYLLSPLFGQLIKTIAQVLLVVFVTFLHPTIRWARIKIARSRIVSRYIEPALNRVMVPYFAFLRRLPPYWATFSIALPLAILEPAKLFATIMIAERPKAGIVLWLLLQALSFVLIEKTWGAVRPQSRKVWLVARLHAWGWLNYMYGKAWLARTQLYQFAIRWKEQAQEALSELFSKRSPSRRSHKF